MPDVRGVDGAAPASQFWPSLALRLAIVALPFWLTVPVLVSNVDWPIKFIVGFALGLTLARPDYGLILVAAVRAARQPARTDDRHGRLPDRRSGRPGVLRGMAAAGAPRSSRTAKRRAGCRMAVGNHRGRVDCRAGVAARPLPGRIRGRPQSDRAPAFLRRRSHRLRRGRPVPGRPRARGGDRHPVPPVSVARGHPAARAGAFWRRGRAVERAAVARHRLGGSAGAVPGNWVSRRRARRGCQRGRQLLRDDSVPRARHGDARTRIPEDDLARLRSRERHRPVVLGIAQRAWSSRRRPDRRRGVG